ncbi:MAG TPA: hypothetical protein VGD12_06565 [Blastococcus sp.]
MTGQPPPPPSGGQPPEHGQQPPPGYGQQPAPGFGPPPGYGQQPPPGFGPPPGYGHPTHGRPGGGVSSFAFAPEKLRTADYVIAGGTLLFLILSFFTWYDLSDDEFFGVDFTVSGWTGSGNVKTAFFLFLLAAVWSALPALYDVELGFPRSWITVGLAALGVLLTLFAWFDTFDFEFSIWALLGLLTAVAILVGAVLSLLPELRNRPAPAGGPAGAGQWADQPGPQHGQQGRPGPLHAQGTQAEGTRGQPPPQQYAPPPAPPGHAPPRTGPPAQGGSTSAGHGPEGPAGG